MRALDPYEELCQAVVIQAVKDCLSKSSQISEDAKRFLVSEEFSMYSNLDGKTILRIINEREKNNDTQ